jgi:hypothetical protein
MTAALSGVGGLGALSLTSPLKVGSLNFVTRAGKRRGQNWAPTTRPRERHNGHCIHTHETALSPHRGY